MKLYELCGADRDVRFSPYVWRAKLCLLHKGLDFTAEPITFLEKEKIAHAQSQTVPVLDDGDISVADSFAIAEYLEDTKPGPSLFGGVVARAQAPVLGRWTDQNIISGIVFLILTDIHEALDADNQAYFRESREMRFGTTLEEAMADPAAKLEKFRRSLMPLRQTLKAHPYLSGEQPFWFDYAVFGAFMWAHIVSDFALLSEDDPLYAWRERMMDLFDGAGRSAKRAR